MKRLVTLAACLAMLTLSGCANGFLGGGLFKNGCNSGCNTRSGLFGGNGMFSDGPIRQFMRGDACDSCNAAAGQVDPAYTTPGCDSCANGTINDPYAMPAGAAPNPQPVTSFYPGDNGISAGQTFPGNSGVSSMEPGAILGTPDSFGAAENLSEPPTGGN